MYFLDIMIWITENCFYTLPSSGDVSVNELFDNYIAFYKIDLMWIIIG